MIAVMVVMIPSSTILAVELMDIVPYDVLNVTLLLLGNTNSNSNVNSDRSSSTDMIVPI